MKKYSYIRTIRTFVTKHSTWFAAVFFFMLASFMTWPFVINPLHTMAAPIGGDVGNSVLQFEAIKREGLNPLVDGVVHSIAQSDGGIKVNVGVDRVSFFSTMFLWLVTLATNAITAHSLMTFTGYFLTSFITFLFIRKVTGSASIGMVGGYTYGFFPHLVTLARAAPPYTHMWLFVLPVWAFWNLINDEVTKKRIAIAILSVLPAIFWTPYYTFHVLLVGLACLVVAFVLLRNRIGSWKTIQITGLIGVCWVLIAVAYKFIGLSTQYASVPVRTLQEAYEQSAHPLMYALPGMFTTWGEPLYRFLIHHEPRAAGTNLYIGLSCILLAGIGVFFLLRRQVDRGAKIALWLGVSITFFAFIFSLAPTIHILGVDVPTPNKIIVSVVPALRAGQRLVMPLMAGIAILSSLGLYLLSKHFSRAKYYIFVVIAFLLIATDLSINLPEATTVFPSHASLTKLATRPPGLTAQYYESSLVTNPQQHECLPQLQHKMPLLNDCALARDPNYLNIPPPVLGTVTNLPICEQPKRLKQLNVKYVITSTDDNVIKKCVQDTLGVKPILQDNVYTVYSL